MSDSKVCTKCKEEKPLTEFHKYTCKKDGRHNICKVCSKVRWTRYYQENREVIIKKTNPWNKPNKGKATSLLRSAIISGRIIRGSCHCGSGQVADGHHCDYIKPLDVMWLCRSCHRQWHVDNGPGLNG